MLVIQIITLILTLLNTAGLGVILIGVLKSLGVKVIPARNRSQRGTKSPSRRT